MLPLLPVLSFYADVTSFVARIFINVTDLKMFIHSNQGSCEL